MRRPDTPPNVQQIIRQNASIIVEILANPDTEKIIQKINNEYLHWEEVRRRPLPSGITHEQVWAVAKILRAPGHKRITFGGKTFQYTLTSEMQKKLHILDKNATGYLETEAELSPTGGKERYIISSLMEEAIASSQIEGAVTTRKVAKEMLRLNRPPKNYSDQMIVNGYKTIQKITKMKDKTITPQILLDIQQEITAKTLEDKHHEGSFRTTNDVVVGDTADPTIIYHIPPDHEKVSLLIDEFCKFASDDEGEFIHPIVKGIILHFLIGYIHPFNDGNGRTARSIVYWYGLTRGYWLFEYMAISRIILRSRAKYGLAYLYTETDDNDLTYFIDYNLTSIEEALEDMKTYLERKKKEQAETLNIIKGLKEINVRESDILREFMKSPNKPFTIEEIRNIYGVAYDTARNDLYHLENLGHIEKTKVKKKFIFRFRQQKE